VQAVILLEVGGQEDLRLTQAHHMAVLMLQFCEVADMGRLGQMRWILAALVP
jgi:hypothetical protein